MWGGEGLTTDSVPVVASLPRREVADLYVQPHKSESQPQALNMRFGGVRRHVRRPLRRRGVTVPCRGWLRRSYSGYRWLDADVRRCRRCVRLGPRLTIPCDERHRIRTPTRKCPCLHSTDATEATTRTYGRPPFGWIRLHAGTGSGHRASNRASHTPSPTIEKG
jgi:hypothetical protein